MQIYQEGESRSFEQAELHMLTAMERSELTFHASESARDIPFSFTDGASVITRSKSILCIANQHATDIEACRNSPLRGAALR